MRLESLPKAEASDRPLWSFSDNNLRSTGEAETEIKYVYFGNLVSSRKTELEAYLHSSTGPIKSSSDILFNGANSFNLTSLIEKCLNQISLSENIKLNDPNNIRRYLLEYSDLIPILTGICKLTRIQFGSDCQILLEVYNDLEIEDQYLSLCVRQIEYDKNILDEIEIVSDKIEDILVNIGGWLIITTDFRNPT